MRADFDPDHERFIFTACKQAETLDELTYRIRVQVRHFELRLLEQHRSFAIRVTSTGRVGRILVHDPADSLLTYKLLFNDGQVPAADWFAAENVESAHVPTCMCGDSLRYMSCRERVTVFFETEGFTGGSLQAQVEAAMKTRPPIFCDICEQWLPASSGVWTCENGTLTILHATGYDVCESCMIGC